MKTFHIFISTRYFRKLIGPSRSYGSCIYKYQFMQSVPITTKVVSANPAHGEMYFIQHYVIKFASDLQQIGGFLRVPRSPPPIKLTATI